MTTPKRFHGAITLTENLAGIMISDPQIAIFAKYMLFSTLIFPLLQDIYGVVLPLRLAKINSRNDSMP